MHIESTNACTGCGACYNKCSVGAIEMIPSDLGFLKPVVNSNCIDCGSCKIVCPIESTITRIDRIEPITYAMYSTETECLTKSSSGGMFIKLGKYIIEKFAGVVFGAIYAENHQVKISKAETLEELDKMAGSKYIYSNTGNIFQEVKKCLLDNKMVLYSGLPCQIAGLYRFLGKDYKNLITVDILCHGAASQGLFDKYIQYLEKQNGVSIKSVNQRTFIKKWSPLILKRVKITWENGKEEVHDEDYDPFMSLYIREIPYNTSCYSCHYIGLIRNADITLGDYGGLGIYSSFYNPHKRGVSMVIVNTRKGNDILEQIKGVYREERDVNETIVFNTCLYKTTSIPKRRAEFIQDYMGLSETELFIKYYKSDYKYQIRTIIKRLIIKIFGAKNVMRIIAQNKRIQ